MEEMVEKRGPGRPPKTIAPVDDMRGEMRKEMRSEDPREAAKRRAAEIMENTAQLGLDGDKFHIPLSLIPDGWIYNWKTRAVYNEEQKSRMNAYLRTGWTFVPQDRHPDYPVDMDGMVLMEIPEEVYETYNNRSEQIAKSQVRMKEDQLKGSAVQNLGDGFDSSNKGNSIGKGIRKSYEPMPIPK